jgi:hypothetical protein
MNYPTLISDGIEYKPTTLKEKQDKDKAKLKYFLEHEHEKEIERLVQNNGLVTKLILHNCLD